MKKQIRNNINSYLTVFSGPTDQCMVPGSCRGQGYSSITSDNKANDVTCMIKNLSELLFRSNPNISMEGPKEIAIQGIQTHNLKER